MSKKQPQLPATGAKAAQLARADRARSSNAVENHKLAKQTKQYGEYQHVAKRTRYGQGKKTTPRWITPVGGITSVVVNAVGHGKRR
jgi:alkylhydroperoxidase family enzyme